MEYKMRKTMALGAVIMLCAVAIIGVGYAAFNGNARTYNEGNSADAGFMTLTPTGASEAVKWEAISNAATEDFSSYVYSDSGTKTAYYFDDVTASTATVTVDGTAGYFVSKLGDKSFNLLNNTDSAIASYTLKVIQDDAAGNASFLYIVKVGDVYKSLSTSGATSYASGALEFTVTPASNIAVGGNADVTVELYIGYKANVYVPDTFMGAAVTSITANYIPAIQTAAVPEDLSGLTLGFSAENPTAPANP